MFSLFILSWVSGLFNIMVNCLGFLDLKLLGGLLDIFPFASDDVEARNALWNVIARILVRIREPEMSPSRVHHYVSVLVTKLDLIEDELLNQQVDSGDEQHTLCSGSAANARNASVSFS